MFLSCSQSVTVVVVMVVVLPRCFFFELPLAELLAFGFHRLAV